MNQLTQLRVSTQNLMRLCWLRWIVLVAQIAVLLFLQQSLHSDVSSLLLTYIVGLYGIANLLTHWRLEQPRPVLDSEYFAQLCLDVGVLTCLLFFTGGANNPFVSFYLVPLSISAVLMPPRYTWAMAAVSIAAYTTLLFYYVPLPAFAPAPMGMDHHGHGDLSGGITLHTLGMWINFTLSALLITVFLVKMSSALKRQQAELAHNREQHLLGEQVLAVATLAAGTAHELGTPLSTMKVVVDDMVDSDVQNPTENEDLHLLQSQIDRCKQILRNLVNTAELAHKSEAGPIDVGKFVNKSLENWTLIRPDVRFSLRQQDGSAPAVMDDSTLEQALVNLLNNAVDASKASDNEMDPEPIEVAVNWNADYASITVRDFGDGIDPSIIESLGKPVLSNKDDGMGLGLFLTHAAVNRCGGSMTLYPHPHRGSIAELRLPIMETE